MNGHMYLVAEGARVLAIFSRCAEALQMESRLRLFFPDRRFETWMMESSSRRVCRVRECPPGRRARTA